MGGGRGFRSIGENNNEVRRREISPRKRSDLRQKRGLSIKAVTTNNRMLGGHSGSNTNNNNSKTTTKKKKREGVPGGKDFHAEKNCLKRLNS